jgi:Tfp pilus assembly protein PilZ
LTPLSQKLKDRSLTNRVKELLRDISPFVDNASEDQKRRLLILLEELRRTDRRRYPRKKYSAAVTYATLDRVFKAFVRNICDGGVFIETTEPLIPGEEITLTISFPNDIEPIKLAGEIVWSIEDRGIGVRFTTPNHDLMAKIRSL